MSREHGGGVGLRRAEGPFVARLGLALMATSFLVYGVYGLLPFLALDAARIAGIAVGAWLASWGLFSLGAALVGRNAAGALGGAIHRLWRHFREKGGA